MTDRWDDIAALFEAALKQPSEAREGWLKATCPSGAVREEVRQMLKGHERAGGILDRPLRTPPASPKETASVQAVGRAGPYALLQEVGRGGMGVVYKAHDSRLDRFVALKFLPPPLSNDPHAAAQLDAEARAVAALDHPNICTIYDIGTAADLFTGQDRSSLYIAMAYYEGPTLKDRIDDGRLAVSDGLRFAIQIAKGLGYAHEAGLVHRDVKPSNLILTERGDIKILDFGIATWQREVEETGPNDPAGTVAYMAPEQLKGTSTDPRTDLWALGVVLYELLTGQHPFRMETDAPLAHALLHEDPPALTTVRPECPDPLDDVLKIALAKDPDERYASATELVADLKSARSIGAASSARGSSPSSPPVGPLPVSPTSFVGRDHELKAVKALLSEHRLVTLTGPAGSGKTRLALRVAHTIDAPPDGIFFVPLAPVSTARRVASTIAQVLDVDEHPSQPITERLKYALQETRALLILDNFEHVISAASCIADLLAACPGLHVLVTSREALRISGERELSVPPLDVPGTDASLAPGDLRRHSAVALFADRAEARRSSFALTKANARPVAELCRRLEGLPLAIELAAARIKLLAPRDILERLSNRLDLLQGAPRDRPARHQTLRQAIAWSYDLLNEQEQAFFRRLAVFTNGCTLETAEAVVDVPNPLDLNPIDGMNAMVERNLLHREDTPQGPPRFLMLETIRAYGLERLNAEGEATAVRRAHADCFLALAEAAGPELTGPNQGDWLTRLDAERDNLRSALSWAEEHGDAQMDLRMGAALWRLWAARGPLRDGCRRLMEMLDRPENQERTRARARALNAAGTLLHETSTFPAARARLEESLSIWRETNDQEGRATALNNLGWVAVQTSEYSQARALSEEALSLCQTLGDTRGAALSLNNLGWIAMLRGAFDTARSLYEESLTLRRDLKDERGTAFALTNLAWAQRFRGRYERATTLLTRALSILRSLKDEQLIAWNRNIQALVAHGQGNITAAAIAAEDSVALWREVGNVEGLSFALCTLAAPKRDQGDLHAATASLNEAVPLIREIGTRWDLAWAHWLRGSLFSVEGKTGKAQTQYQRGLKIWMDLGAQWGIVKGLEALAETLLPAAPHRATQYVSLATSLRETLPAPRPPLHQSEYDQLVDELHARLGEKAFRAAWHEGHTKEIEDINSIC